MTKFGIIGAALLSVVVAAPTLAASRDDDGMNRGYRGYDGRVIEELPAESDIGYPGPYDDGNYTRPHDDYMRVPPSAHGG